MKSSKNDPKKHGAVEESHATENPSAAADTTNANNDIIQPPNGNEPLAAGNGQEAVNNALEVLQTKYDQLNDTYLRTLAEYDNYRKRTLKEKSELIKTGGESVLVSVLTVVDDMERGIKAAANATDVDAVKEGMELINNKFQAFLKQQGIKVMETDGQAFDTDHHEAIATIPAPDESSKGKVLDCVQKGYYLHDKVIRFAKVVVGE